MTCVTELKNLGDGNKKVSDWVTVWVTFKNTGANNELFYIELYYTLKSTLFGEDDSYYMNLRHFNYFDSYYKCDGTLLHSALCNFT